MVDWKKIKERLKEKPSYHYEKNLKPQVEKTGFWADVRKRREIQREAKQIRREAEMKAYRKQMMELAAKTGAERGVSRAERHSRGFRGFAKKLMDYSAAVNRNLERSGAFESPSGSGSGDPFGLMGSRRKRRRKHR